MEIPLFKMYSDEKDVRAVSDVIKRGSYWAVGPEVEEFEKEMVKYLGIKYTLTFNSGTSALHALLLAHDIKGKEVIVPSFSFVATANTVVLAGGKPIFAEVESETFGLEYNDVINKINKNTKIIMPIHYGGFPARDIEKIINLAKRKKILLIEDAAQSLGSKIKEKMIGTLGDGSIFSFCQDKTLSTGEGGIIATNSEKIYHKLKLIRSHGRTEVKSDCFLPIKDHDCVEPGYNFRMSSMTAALGISQLKKIGHNIKLRREKGRYLSNSLSRIKEVSVPKELLDTYQVYQKYTIQLESKQKRDRLQNHLTKKGIATKIYFEPIHLKTIYKEKYGLKKGDLPKTEELSSRVLTIPLYPLIKKEELDYIIKMIKDFFINEL